jgi:hypothetical protein
MYEELSRWEAALGAPKTVSQADEGQTFFYWPEHGIGVFTHPLYESQFRSKQQEDRRVTSVILPLQHTLQPSFLPVADDLVIRFDEVMDLQGLLPDSSTNGQKERLDGASHIDLVSSPFRKTAERLYFRNGEPIAIEIRDVWWFSHYD